MTTTTGDAAARTRTERPARRIYTLAAALTAATRDFFTGHEHEARAALAQINDASEVLPALLDRGRPAAARAIRSSLLVQARQHLGGAYDSHFAHTAPYGGERGTESARGRRPRVAHLAHGSGPRRTTRSRSPYTLIPPPRTKPTRVSRARSASSTASEDGADTAATTGMRAARAFWAIS